MIQGCGFRWTFLLMLGGVLAAHGGAGAPAFSQGKKEAAWQVLFAYAPDGKKSTDEDEILLRPNVSQPVYFYLNNLGKLKKKNLKVKLLRQSIQEKMEQWLNVAEALVAEADINKPQRIPFKLPATDKKDAPPPPLIQDGPPFLFHLEVYENEKPLMAVRLPATIQQPFEYIQVKEPVFDKNGLSVNIGFKDDYLADPPCPVELVLNSDLLPGLATPMDRVLKGNLSSKQRELTLSAKGFAFEKGFAPKNGRICLTVDGYERAFMFRTAFSQGNLPALRKGTRVRIKAPRYYHSSAKAEPKEGKKSLALGYDIEADGEMDANLWLEVAFDRQGNENFASPDFLRGLREQTLAVAKAQPDGSLLFKTSVRDWNRPLETEGVGGKALLRVQVWEMDGKDKRLVPLVDEQNKKDEAVFLFDRDGSSQNRFAPLRFKNDAVTAEIMVDPPSPQGVEFVNLPTQAPPGTKVVLKATAKKAEELAQARTKVQFFLGDPQKDPPTEGIFDGKRHWRAELLVPPDAKDKVIATVTFTTAENLTASTTDKILIKLVKDSVEKSKITGMVTYDERPQPDNPVKLLVGKKLVMETKANDKGVYVFLNVPKGKYRVSATQSGMFGGSAPAVISKDEGETVKADINLKRIP